MYKGADSLPKERCKVFADGKSAVMDDFRTTRFYGGGKNVRGKQAKGFAEELHTFLNVCRNGGAWPISWQSMVRTRCVCFGAMQSLQTSDRVNVSSRVRKRDGS